MTAYGLTALILYHLTKYYLFWHSCLRYLACNWEWVQESRAVISFPRGGCYVARWCLTHCTTETLPAMLQRQGRLRCGCKQDLSWGCTSKGTLPRCQWPLLCSCVGLCISRTQGWRWVWWGAKAPAHHGPELLPLLEQCAIGACFRHSGGFWTMKCVVSCLGCCLSSVYLLEGNLQTPRWKVRWILLLLSEGGKCPVLKQGQPVLPYFTPTRPLDLSLIHISPHKNPAVDYRLEPKWRKKRFYTASQNSIIALEYVWQKKTDKAIDSTNQKEMWDERRLRSLICLM